MSEKIDWRDLPPVEPGERPTVPHRPSQTFLRHHDRCDRAAMLYLLYKAGAGSHPLNRGSVVHEVLARLTRYAVEQGEPKIRDTHLGKEFLREYMAENPQLQINAVERDAARYMVANFCIGEVWDPARVIAVETTFVLQIGEWEIVGRIDRADDLGGGVLEIVDYKTSFAMTDPEEFKPESTDSEGNDRFSGDFQTMLYALALAEGTFDDGLPLGGDYERFKLRLAYPRYLNAEGLAARTAVVTRQQLLDFKLDVEDQLKRLSEVNIGEGKWQPTPGSHCAECPAEYACPLPALLRPESQHANLNTLPDLERVAAAHFFMARRATTLKGRLKKAALRIGDEQPELLALPSGEKGVYAGTDQAYIFIPKTVKETIDPAKLEDAIEATRFGEELDPTEHYRYRESIEFAKRKVPPRPEPRPKERSE